MPLPPEKPFKPRLGKPGNRGGRFSKRVLKKLRSLSHGITSFGSSKGNGGFTGARIGRGHWAGKYSSHNIGSRFRRVIIKSRIVKLGGGGYARAASHLKYIEREGVGSDGREAEAYDKEQDGINLNDFQGRCEGDRHQFRFIVSANDADSLEDLKSFTRDVMTRMEQDLRTELDWVAVDHFDTVHPHTHIVLRGIDDQNRDLIIAKSYMGHGMRHAASDLLTHELGPRTEMEMLKQVRQQVAQDRFTDLDRDIVKYSRDNIMHPDGGEYPAKIIGARMKKLSKMGLAQHLGKDYWRLDPDLKNTLTTMAEKGDIIKTLHRNLHKAGKDNLQQKALVFGTDETSQKSVTGELLTTGLSDELSDRRYVILDGTDGNHWYVDMGELEQVDDLNMGMIVTVTAAHSGASLVDHHIAEIARQNGGVYSEEYHQHSDPKASQAYIKSHIRRLEGLRRYGIGKRQQDGSWKIPTDFTYRIEKLQKQFAQKAPVAMTINSAFALDQLIEGEGYGWLDRNLVGKEKTDLASSGFGGKVQQALAQRRNWLMRQGLIQKKGSKVIYPKSLANQLIRRELNKFAAGISDKTGKQYMPMKDRGEVSGIYVRKLNLSSGQYAVLEKSKEFTLVPWRPVMDRVMGRSISGMISGGTVNWDIGRGVGL